MYRWIVDFPLDRHTARKSVQGLTNFRDLVTLYIAEASGLALQERRPVDHGRRHTPESASSGVDRSDSRGLAVRLVGLAGRSEAWLSRHVWDVETPGSNPGAPISFFRKCMALGFEFAFGPGAERMKREAPV